MTPGGLPFPSPVPFSIFDSFQFGSPEAIFTLLAVALLVVAIPLGIVAGIVWERARSSQRKATEAMLQDKIAALQSLVEIEQVTTSTLSLNEQLDLMLLYALSQVHADVAIVFLQDLAARELRVFSQRGARSPELLTKFKVSIGEGATGWVAEQGQPLSVPEVQTDPRWLASETFANEGIVSYLGVPLRAEGRVIGVLDLMTRARREFSSEEIDLIAMFGARLAVVVKNGQLIEEARRRADEFQALYQTTRDLAAQQDLFALLKTVVERATALLHARNGHIYLYDQSAGDLELATAVNDFPIPTGTRIKVGEGVAGRVAQSRQPMIVDDYHTWEHRSPLYEAVPFTGVLQVPMIFRGELVGVLGVNDLRTTERKFSESDAHILSLFAAQVAGAVRNALLLEETRARATELEAVRRASLILTSRLDLRAVLDEILKSALTLLPGASDAHIYLYRRERLVFGAALVADGLPERPSGEPRLNGLTYSVARRGEMIVVPDMQTHPLYADAPKDWKGAIVGLPLKIGERVVGVMNIAYWQPRVFAETELRVLRLLGDQAAVAIGNAQLHEDVQASETRYRSLVENIPLGIYRARPDARGKLLMTNPAFRRMFGFDAQVPVEQIYAADLHVKPEEWGAFSDNVLRQGSVNGAELLLSRKDGSTLFGLVTARVVYQDGEPAYFDCTIQDISERKQAEEQFRQQVNEMAAITRVSQEITSVPDLKPVLTSIARNATELSQSDASGVYSYQPDGVLRIVASYGVTAEFVQQINTSGIKPGRGAIGRAAVERRPVQIPDVQALQDYPFTQFTQLENIRSIMAVPMLRADEIKGGIVLWRRQPHHFSDQEMTLLQALAQQCLNAIENARLFEETQHRAEQLYVLNEMSRALASTLELHSIYRAARQHITQLFDCSTFGLAFFEPEGPSITTAYMVCDGQEVDLAQFPPLPYDPQSSSGRSKAIASGRPFIVDELSRRKQDQTTQADAQASPFSSALYLPMMVENQVVGVLEMASHQSQAFRSSDAELLGPVANQIGLAIQNAKLFAQVQQRAHELAVINQISTSVNQPTALADVLTSTLRELTRALDLDRCALATCTEGREYLKIIAEYNPAPGPSRLGLTVSIAENATIQMILRQRRALKVADAPNGARTKDIDLFHPRVNHSMLLIPLIAADEVIGAVELESHNEPRTFTEAEVVLAQTIANQAAAAIERARLFEQTRHRAEQLTVLNRIANAINRARNLDELLEVVYREITDTVTTDAFFLALYDSATNELNYRIRIDEGIREPPERRTVSGGLTAETIKSRRPLLIHDWEKEKDRFPGPQKVWGTMKWPRAWLSVPMLLDDQVIGVISLQTYYPNAFGKEEERLLMTIADQVAVVLERARLLEETQRRALEEETINDITRALNASLDIRQAFPVVANGLRLLTGCEDARLALLDEMGQYRLTQVVSDSNLALCEATSRPIAETAAAKHILTGRVHLIGDLADATEFPAERELCEAGYRSQINLPLVVGEHVIGALNLVSRQVGAFSVRHLPVLQQIAASVAIAIENARLFEAEQARRAELSALYDLSRSLADATDFHVILNLVAQRAVETLRVTFARIALLEEETLVVRSAYPIRVLDHDLAVGRRIPASTQPYSLHVLQHQNAPVLIQRDDASIDLSEREQLFLHFAQTLCLVPLRAGERAFGILMLGEERNPQREPFGPDRLRLAHNIGDQAASALRRAELFVELEHSYLQSVLSLAKAVDVRDTYTADHAQRLAEMALALGKRIGLSMYELEDLRYGALLHDIGKIGVPDAILQKPGPLDDDEWQQMRRHPEIGEQIIRPIPRLAGAARIVRHHHERVDGKGYPDGLAGEQIPIGARVLSVVDAYSAMMDQRIYKQPLSPPQVRNELQQASGTQFDAPILEAFLELIDGAPNGGK